MKCPYCGLEDNYNNFDYVICKENVSNKLSNIYKCPNCKRVEKKEDAIKLEFQEWEILD
ncbi:hypothetical protein EJM73_08740 [Clostridium botulinum]|uniref:hypothetical protein n=1 Tax=Clostridium botulinum TaxID=1491 RepID=UPI0013762A4B|nr:hypothetical protein [Clostridium botulinum]NCI19710.1 hypothetical protein [Clostridium botulinum]NCI35748.1 hypothetical protein [Clostridium botulinum]NCI71605.1 hypothetical protein [Clostridium botulinum]NDI38797.1 hypothetical protein [Clostridium botulinum]